MMNRFLKHYLDSNHYLRFVFILIITAFVSFSCNGSDDGDDGGSEIAAEFIGITIKGRITNLNEAKDYVSADTSLQIVSLPSNHSVPFTIDGQGRYEYTSDLEIIAIPSTGSFAFEVDSLTPGEYIIALQLLDAPLFGFLTDASTQEIEIVEIQDGYTTPLVIDLGNTTMPAP